MNTINAVSSIITQKKEHGAAQAMLYATGFNKKDFEKAQIGIVSQWYEGNPCNMHLGQLAQKVKEGVNAHKEILGLCFHTIGVSDGISMGTSGMSYSLPSRELIADSIETVMQAQWYDALVTIPGCDKNIPGSIIAMCRVNRPSILVYGGSIGSGRSIAGEKLDIVSAFQSYGQYLEGKISESERSSIIENACPGAGACGGMYTANTMACAAEAMGISLPYSSSIPALDDLKVKECFDVSKYLISLMENNIRPSDIITKKSLENAITLIVALGGSTNAVLHILAIASSLDIDLSLEDFQKISNRTPYLADLKPSGEFLMEDLHKVGGTPAVIKYLFSENILHKECMTVTGKTLEDNVRNLPSLLRNQTIIRTRSNPIAKKGHLKILFGNLAPKGSVAKITGKEGTSFRGPAHVFDSEEDMLEALKDKKIHKGSVIVIRYKGPKGGPGMPEMLNPTAAIVGAGLSKDVALITDGRFSGGSHGFIVGHICPEAFDGGPISLVENGDMIHLDAVSLSLNLEISENEFERRKQKLKIKKTKIKKGYLKKYIKTVSPADKGCTTDE